MSPLPQADSLLPTHFSALFLLIGLLLGTATAQVDRGSIAGTVKDSTNAVLPGALVELQQKGPSAVSDGQGKFLLTNLQPGSYTLTVSYVGFAPLQVTVTVAAGQT